MKKGLTLAFALLAMAFAIAQKSQDPVLFEIGGEQIRQSEFMKEFLRSIGKDPAAAPTACTYEKRKALEDYVQLFVNYRTKLHDAYALGMDTAAALRKELASYRNELAAPYLIDSATMASLVDEAYQRNHYAVHAAHILLPLKASASPDDTLRIYNEALSVYNRVTTGKENFFSVAREIMDKKLSPEEKERMGQVAPGHEGDLGFFTVFDMIYPFENTAYTLEVGAVSKPVRTRYGYHIIKVIDRVPYYGSTHLRHIWISKGNSKAEGNIRSAYNKIKDGMDFERVAHNYSDDRRTSSKGGDLGTLSMHQMPPEYISIIGRQGLKDGDVSEPFHTEYGWHIIKVEHLDSIPSLADLQSTYRQRMTRDQRNNAPQAAFVEQCKQRYNFKDNTIAAKGKRAAATLTEIASLIDDKVFKKQWDFDTSKITNRTPLFTIGDKSYDAVDFGRYIALNQSVQGKLDINEYVRTRYQDFIAAKVLEIADQRLEQDNAEFRSLIDEYRHGLMIFNYNDQQIWSKAMKDTAGFAAFYATASVQHSIDNPEDSVYFWNDRARVVIYTVSDSVCLDPDKAVKIIAKGEKKNRSASDIRLDLLEKINRKKCNSEKPVVMRTEVVEMGHQTLLDKQEWKIGNYVHPTSKGYMVYVVEQLMPTMLKDIDEARGYYVNDFQNETERQLIEQLRQKYNVKINQQAIDEIVY